MKKLGVPCVPGSDGGVETVEDARKVAGDMGYPVIVKAAAGGGGRGMKLAPTADDIDVAFQSARTEAKAAIDEATRARIGETCAKAVGDMGYSGAGTIEFLFEDGEFYFIEMNTRLQVEHPVTEAVYGVDLVREQIRVAAGEPMTFEQDKLAVSGHAIECRINAERLPDFVPSPGTITAYHAPGGLGVRMDSALYHGYSIPPYYDRIGGGRCGYHNAAVWRAFARKRHPDRGLHDPLVRKMAGSGRINGVLVRVFAGER